MKSVDDQLQKLQELEERYRRDRQQIEIEAMEACWPTWNIGRSTNSCCPNSLALCHPLILARIDK